MTRPRTPFDIHIDGFDRAQLRRADKRFHLGIGRWHTTSRLRWLVSDGMRVRLEEAEDQSPEAVAELLRRW